MQNGNISNVPPNPYIAKQLRTIQELVNRTNTNNLLTTSGSDISVNQGPLGTNIDFNGLSTQSNSFSVVLVPTGPSGEADFTDGRYWAQSVLVGQAAGASATDPAQIYINQTASMWYSVVHNLNELTTGTHALLTYNDDRTQPVTGVPIYTVTQIDALKQTIDPVSDIPNSLFVIRGDSPIIRHARITAVTPINGAIQFLYQIQLGRFIDPALGYAGTWVDDTISTNTFAFNSAEDLNTFVGTGTIGTGATDVDSSDGSIGMCSLLPIPINGTVVVTYRATDEDGINYYTIVNAMNSSQ